MARASIRAPVPYPSSAAQHESQGALVIAWAAASFAYSAKDAHDRWWSGGLQCEKARARRQAGHGAHGWGCRRSVEAVLGDGVEVTLSAITRAGLLIWRCGR